LLRLTRKYNLPFGIEATGHTLEAIAAIDPAWVDELRRLMAEGRVSLSAADTARLLGRLSLLK